MLLRRWFAAAVVVAVIGVPAIALAGSDHPSPSAHPTSASEPSSPTSATAEEVPSSETTRQTADTAASTSTSAPQAIAPRKPADPVVVDATPTVERIEHLRLACEPVRADTEPPGVHRRGIACRWSPSSHPAFAGYRLWRSDGEHREIVFRSRDQEAVRRLDTGVEPGGHYLYVVEAVSKTGRVIGRGGPVRVELPDPPRHEELRLECAPATDAGLGIACGWSESRHPDAVGYVLVRSVDGGDRAVIYRGGLDRTRFLDTEVRPVHRFTYAVIVVDAEGETLGSGGPVVVGLRP